MYLVGTWIGVDNTKGTVLAQLRLFFVTAKTLPVSK